MIQDMKGLRAFFVNACEERTHDYIDSEWALSEMHALDVSIKRANNEKTGEDLVRSMFIRCYDCAMSRDQRIGAKNVRYKGDELITLCTMEGAWLGKMEGDIRVVKTFVTYDMMSGLQAEVLTPHLEAIKRGHDAADELILKFNNRKTLRTNQPIKKEV